METNIRVPRKMRRYFSSICLVSAFMMVLLGPGTIIATLAQTMSFLNITNFIGSVGNMIKSITGFGKEGSCHFKCPDGRQPQPNPVHASTTNGCGVFGFQVDSQLFPAVTKCCETHDLCYDVCNSNKSKCDTDFQNCLKMICKDLHKATGGAELYEGCVSIADLAYKATDAVGCKTFLESQSNACICVGPQVTQDSAAVPDQNSTADSNQPDGSSAKGKTGGKEAPSLKKTKYGNKKGEHNQPPLDDVNNIDSINKKGYKRTSKEDNQQRAGSEKSYEGFAKEDPQGHMVYSHADILRANQEASKKQDDRKKGQKGSTKWKRGGGQGLTDDNDDNEDDSDDDKKSQSKYDKRKRIRRKEEL